MNPTQGNAQMATAYITRPYRYADGVAYRPNLFQIKPFNSATGETGARTVGGAIKVAEGKWFAYAGSPIILQDKIASIIARADAYVWGSSKQEACAKIRPHLPETL